MCVFSVRIWISRDMKMGICLTTLYEEPGQTWRKLLCFSGPEPCIGICHYLKTLRDKEKTKALEGLVAGGSGNQLPKDDDRDKNVKSAKTQPTTTLQSGVIPKLKQAATLNRKESPPERKKPCIGICQHLAELGLPYPYWGKLIFAIISIIAMSPSNMLYS